MARLTDMKINKMCPSKQLHFLIGHSCTATTGLQRDLRATGAPERFRDGRCACWNVFCRETEVELEIKYKKMFALHKPSIKTNKIKINQNYMPFVVCAKEENGKNEPHRSRSTFYAVQMGKERGMHWRELCVAKKNVGQIMSPCQQSARSPKTSRAT